MAKKIINKQVSREFVLMPVAWLDRLIDLANEEGVGVQQLKGYVASGEIILFNGKRVGEEKYYEI